MGTMHILVRRYKYKKVTICILNAVIFEINLINIKVDSLHIQKKPNKNSRTGILPTTLIDCHSNPIRFSF